MKKLLASLCLTALLAGFCACVQTPPETPSTSQPEEPLRVSSYEAFYDDGTPILDEDGVPLRAIDTDIGTIRFTERDDGIYINYIANRPQDLDAFALPAYIDGKPVVCAGWASLKNMGCKELLLPETMKGVTLSTSSFETIVIPKSLELIHFDRSVYRNAVVDPDNPYFSEIDGVLVSKDKTVLIKYPGMREEKSYTVPACIMEIAGGAFSRSNPEEIIIPPTVTKLPDPEEDVETLGFYATVVVAPGSAAEAFAKEILKTGIALELVVREF
ncbi:MAG: hypothetical protein FWF60_01860 [Oscillospiraceae bacterium]|nr:hypothetical protein [Oscillospiraceae bacterium]